MICETKTQHLVTLFEKFGNIWVSKCFNKLQKSTERITDAQYLTSPGTMLQLCNTNSTNEKFTKSYVNFNVRHISAPWFRWMSSENWNLMAWNVYLA